MNEFIIFLYICAGVTAAGCGIIVLFKFGNWVVDTDLNNFFREKITYRFRSKTEAEKAIEDRDKELDRRTAEVMRETGWDVQASYRLAEKEYKDQMQEASGRKEKEPEPPRRGY